MGQGFRGNEALSTVEKSFEQTLQFMQGRLLGVGARYWLRGRRMKHTQSALTDELKSPLFSYLLYWLTESRQWLKYEEKLALKETR